MGFLARFTGRTPVTEFALEPARETFAVDASSIDPAVFGLSSYVSPVANVARIDRKTAISVPAVKRARDLIAGSLGGLPLAMIGPDKRSTSSPLLDQPEKNVPRSVTMTRTIEDLLFEGIAWWRVTEFAWTTYPSTVQRIAPNRVSVNESTGVVYIDGKAVADRELIRFDSPNDALLVAGARAIRTALALDAAAARMADEPAMAGFFTPSDGIDPGTDDEIVAMLDAYKAARQARVTGYVPGALTYNSLQGYSPEQLQMADARQHAVLEIARLTGIDPEDLGVSTTSRTYANQQDRRKAFLDFTLGGYRQAVEDRLSLGDTTPRGYVVKFNLSAFLRSDDATRYATYATALDKGFLTLDEVRELEDRPALAAATAPTPIEAPVTADQTHDVTSFAADDVITFDAPTAPETFTVNAETRTIRGLALPFGVVSDDGRTYSFSKGSVTFGDPGRIKLLVAHDWAQAIGRATAIEETDDGLVATFSVARGAAGDNALSMAEDGVWDGLSVGIGRGMKTELRDGIQHVTSAQLREISQTPCPAYDGARITQVAASAAHADEGTQMDNEETQATDFTALTDAIAAGFATIQAPQQGRETISAGGATAVVDEPLPYRFDGVQGEHSLSLDMRAAQQGDSEAKQRIQEFTENAFAVTTGNTSTLNPTQNRPELYVPNLQFTRPLFDAVTTGVITDRTPFTVPKFAAAAGLVNPHTEGVEPTPGSFSATSQTITPGGISGKVEINREVLDQGASPQADQIIWTEMLNGWFEAIEAKIAAQLNALSLTEINLSGAVDGALVTAVQNIFVDLQFVRGGNRYSALALDGSLFKALVNAADGSGRKLLPVVGPTNAQGVTSGNFSAVQIGSQVGSAAWALGTGNAANSYLFVPSSVYCWVSAPQRFDFQYQVKSVDLAIWGYSATAVTRDTDVKRIDYTTADV